MKRVLIDPDGTMQRYLCVVVQAGTGIEYQQQCNGVNCDQRVVEGFLMLLGGAAMELDGSTVDDLPLSDVFHWDGGCVPRIPDGPGLPPDRYARLKALIETIPYWRDERCEALRIDEDRLDELVEAWVPVITLDGPGILTWSNCD